MSFIKSKRCFSKCLNVYGRLKAKYLSSGAWYLRPYACEFEVYALVFIVTKKPQKIKFMNSRFIAWKLSKETKLGCQAEMTPRTLIIKINQELEFASLNISDIENSSIILPKLMNKTSILNRLKYSKFEYLLRFANFYVKKLRKNNAKIASDFISPECHVIFV